MIAAESLTEPDARRQIASLPLVVVIMSPGQRIASVNPVGEQFFGQSLRRLTGRHLLDALHFNEARIAERIGESDAPLSARQIDVAVAGHGSRRLDVTIAPIVDSPGWQILTLHDSAASEAMGDPLLAGEEGLLRAPEILAHEIKNPLAGIRGAAQLLARKVGKNEQALTTLIADEVDRIAKLIDQMQTLSRRTPEPLEPCNLHEVIRRASAVITAGDERGLKVVEEFDPSLPPVLGSTHALVQVLINLLANARDASRESQRPRVIVRTRFASGLQLNPGGKGAPVRLPIEIRVSDNGPGFDPAMRDHIFEPFVTTKKSGQGLGLALVRKLVHDMNGRIACERDEAGGWTHFRLHLAMAPIPGASKKGRGKA